MFANITKYQILLINFVFQYKSDDLNYGNIQTKLVM